MVVKNQNPFSLDDIVQDKGIARVARKTLEKAIGLQYLAKKYNSLPYVESAEEFIFHTFKEFGVSYEISYGKTENLPETGPVMVVANHPTGGLEGMILIDLLTKRRKDIKIMANGFLGRIPEIRNIFLTVNPYGTKHAKKENIAPLKEAVKWLKDGGVLVVFPAGDVSSFQPGQMRISDGIWEKSIIRLAEIGEANILPIYINGRNSLTFYMASLAHPFLKTLLLPRQLINQKKKRFSISIGNLIPLKKLEKYLTDQTKMDYLKMKTYMLAERSLQDKDNKTIAEDNLEPHIDPILITTEIKNLPKEQMLIDGDMQVFYARKDQIPWVVQEIGILREITFREVGEGTGKTSDIDVYDNFYLHLFIWDKTNSLIVGSYRLGLGDEIQETYGKKGFYSHTLFNFNHLLLKKINPAIELGRSFIRPEYQKSFSPLLLLWKGIGAFISRNPRYTVLFGPVSISNNYSSESRDLIVKYFKKKTKKMKHLVKPRNPYNFKPKRLSSLQNIAATTIEELSTAISQIEEDGKGVPILIKQYLKMGGKILAFNTDPNFNNCIDGFIMTDLRETDPKVLGKYMGKEELNEYLNYHSSKDSKGSVKKLKALKKIK